MKEECLICRAPLEYLGHSTSMVCALCGKQRESAAQCVNGHYVCDECHTQGVDSIIGLCLNSSSKNPFVIFSQLVDLPFCHMHGPEHHIMVGASLLTAYKNAGGNIDLEPSLTEMLRRGKLVPGGICGFWGSCGAAVSSGIFVSIVTGATPLSGAEWGLSNLMTSRSLAAMAAIGGPRCCKRNAFIAIIEAAKFCSEHFEIELETNGIVCTHYTKNNQCIGNKCPFRAVD